MQDGCDLVADAAGGPRRKCPARLDRVRVVFGHARRPPPRRPPEASVPAPPLESMTSPDLAIAEPEVCPYLGLPDDPRTRFTFAAPGHRCYVRAKPIPIDLGHQGAYCLSTGYPACERFRSPRAAGRPGSGPPPTAAATATVATAAADATASLASGSTAAPSGAPVPTPLAGSGAARVRPGSRAMPSRDGGVGRGRALRHALALLAVLAVVTLVGAIWAGAIGGSPADGGAPGVVASPSAAATPAPTPTSTATPAPAP